MIPGMKAKGGGSIGRHRVRQRYHGLRRSSLFRREGGTCFAHEALAMELGRYNIRSNIVLPGTVRTPLWERKAGADSTTLERLRKWFRSDASS